MTDDSHSQLRVLVEMAERRVETLKSKLAVVIEAARSLQEQQEQLRDQLESSVQQRHRERAALDVTGAPFRAGVGVLLEQKQRSSLAEETENRERSAAVAELLTATEREIDTIQDLLGEAMAEEQALRKRRQAIHRERLRSREEDELEELAQNARLRSIQKKSE